MKKKLLAGLTIGTMMLLWWGQPAEATTIIAHQGEIAPTAEGFVALASGSPSSAGPIANDLGQAAWSIIGQQDSQLYYVSGALSGSEMTDITNHGFDLTLNARVLQSSALAYDSSNPYVVAFANFDTGSRRFDIMLGVNAQGETVAPADILSCHGINCSGLWP